jgi:hypothetical protein
MQHTATIVTEEPMELDRRARLAGTAGIVAALFWLANWTYLLFVETSAADGGAKWYIGQALAAAAILGTAVLAAGLWAVRAGGPGRFARFALAAWTIAWLLILAGATALIATRNEDNPLFPIGGVLGTLAGIAGGIVIARAGVLDNWRRWTPLALGLWYGLVLGTVMGIAEHSWLATAAELVTYLLILLTAAGLATARLTYPVPASPLAAATVR